MKIKKSKAIQIINEEIEKFSAKIKRGKFVEEFSSVFVEALEPKESARDMIKEEVSSFLAKYTETLLESDLYNPFFTGNEKPVSDLPDPPEKFETFGPKEDDPELVELKQEILFKLGTLDKEQLLSVLNALTQHEGAV